MTVWADNYDKCSLLLPMRGSNGSTVFTDYSPFGHAVTVNGNAQISTAQSKYYGASGLADGTDDYLLLPTHASLNDFGTGQFTIGFWARLTGVASEQAFVTLGGAWPTTVAYVLELRATGDVRLYAGANIPIQCFSGNVMAANTWTHIEASRDGSGVTRLFVGGTQRSSQSSTGSTNIAYNGQPRIFTFFDGTSDMNGNMQDLYIYKGVALHTADFTPPDRLTGILSDAPNGAPVKDDTNTAAARTVHYYPRSFPQYGKASASDGSGHFSIIAPNVAHNVICLDDAAGTQYRDRIESNVMPA